MGDSKKAPVTLTDLFRYADIYGVDITVSYDPLFPGRYLLRFSKRGAHHVESVADIDLKRFNIDDLYRYILAMGCERLNRYLVDNFTKADGNDE